MIPCASTTCFIILNYGSVKTKTLEKEVDNWYLFCIHHPSLRGAQACLENISPDQFWSIADLYPNLVRHLHVQIRLMGNFGMNGGVPWFTNTDGELCLLYKESVEDVSHFRDNRECLWSNLSQKVTACNPACNPSDGTPITHFFSSLEQKILLLSGGLRLPFDQVTVTMVKRFISSAISKTHKLRKEMLRELETPWLPN